MLPNAMKNPEPSVKIVESALQRGLGWRFVVLFVLIFAALDWGYQYTRGTPVETALIDVATVKTSAMLLTVIAPTEQVQAMGHRLVSAHVRMSVLNGCEGTETALLIIAAMLAYAVGWRPKLIGILLGVALVFVLNQLRIITLYLTLRHDAGWFDMLHGYLLPSVIVFAVCGFFLAWAHSATPRPLPDASKN